MDRLRASRRAAQLAFMLVLLLLPVFDILRYDTATRELFLFGGVWELGLREGFYLDDSIGGSAHIAVTFFLKAILPWVLALSVFPLMGFIFGRLFCGWLCPEGAFFEYADFLTQKVLGRKSLFGKSRAGAGPPARDRLLYGSLALASAVTIPPLVALFLAGYFVAPATVWGQALALEFTGGLKAAMVGVTIYMFATFVLVRHAFCKYVCAAGLMQTLFGWVSPVSLRMRFDRANFARCTDCRKCEAVCFMGVKPRAALKDINCVNCGECISACREELGAEGLFSYAFGPGGNGGAERVAVAAEVAGDDGAKHGGRGAEGRGRPSADGEFSCGLRG